MTTAAVSGVDVSLHVCGTYGSMLAMSFEKFIADEDLSGALKKLMKPVEFSEEAFATDLIRKLGTSRTYLIQGRNALGVHSTSRPGSALFQGRK